MDQKGMTLVEVLVAMVLLTLVLVPLLSALLTGTLVTSQAEQRTQATAFAQQGLEQLLSHQELILSHQLPQGFTLENEILPYEVSLEQVVVKVVWGEGQKLRLVGVRRKEGTDL